MAVVEPADLARDVVRMQARAVDQVRRAQARGRVAARLDDEAALARIDRRDGRMERDVRAVAFGVALQREHVLMAVDDARLRRIHRLDALELRLHRHRLGAAERVEGPLTRFSMPFCSIAASCGTWLRAVATSSLPQRWCGTPCALAEFVEHRAAAHAQLGLQRPARIVDARVNHLAVARTRADADPFARLQHDDFAAARRQRPRNGESDHARPNHHAFDLVHVFSAAGSSSCILLSGLLRVAQQRHLNYIVFRSEFRIRQEIWPFRVRKAAFRRLFWQIRKKRLLQNPIAFLRELLSIWMSRAST